MRHWRDGRASAAGEAAELWGHGLDAGTAPAEAACAAADIIVTSTSVTSPLLRAAWVRPGTHLASMGSDARGKQELPAELLAEASLFCDLPEQSRAIGEFQHAPGDAVLTAIGDVLSGVHPGRRSRDEITVFDSPGLALQDLYVARHLLARRKEGALALRPGRPMRPTGMVGPDSRLSHPIATLIDACSRWMEMAYR